MRVAPRTCAVALVDALGDARVLLQRERAAALERAFSVRTVEVGRTRLVGVLSRRCRWRTLVHICAPANSDPSLALLSSPIAFEY